MEIIARIRSPFAEKFGVPRQSGLVETAAEIVFEPPYRTADALRGLEGFSHVWLLWEFHQMADKEWTPTVRPPRLGGNARMGVFATRSPHRPNPIGLSCVRLLGMEETKDGPVLRISGADLVDGTPIYDIKPYLSYCDSHPEATGGWTDSVESVHLSVDFPEDLLSAIPENDRPGLLGVLAQDPRPRYQDDPERIYGLTYKNVNVKFLVVENTLRVKELKMLNDKC